MPCLQLGIGDSPPAKERLNRGHSHSPKALSVSHYTGLAIVVVLISGSLGLPCLNRW